jgi:hypothetical protein
MMTSNSICLLNPGEIALGCYVLPGLYGAAPVK